MIPEWKVTAKTRTRQRTARVRAKSTTGAMKAFKKLHKGLWKEGVRSICATRVPKENIR